MRWGRTILVWCAAGLVLAAVASPATVSAREPVPALNTAGGTAVKGYDAVAYFTDHQPIKGSPQFSYKWQGAIWQFSSAEHRDAFMRDPNRYNPQYGGYCAYAVSQNNIVDIDPHQWQVVDGKLYLNANLLAQKLWERDPTGHIKKADANWPNIPRRPL